jgi:DNA-binding IclR family transcriptional regulator
MPPTATRPLATVERAVAVLDALADAPEGLGTNEVARRIQTNASTASRLLGTLAAAGLVEREGDGARWRLGLRLVELGDAVLARLDIRALARPFLEALVAGTGETATLSAPGEEVAVTVDFVTSSATTVSLARIGRPSLPHATAAGKVLLAFGGGDRFPRDLDALTDRTITDRARLRAEVARVRDRGWAEAAGEREPDLNALAAPVLDRRGELVAIVGLQGPAARLTAQRRKEILPALLDACGALSAKLGAAPPAQASVAR